MKKRVLSFLIAVNLILISTPVNATLITDKAADTISVENEAMNVKNVSENQLVSQAASVSQNTEEATTLTSSVTADTDKAVKDFLLVTADDASYDARNYGLVTEVKHQSGANCWIYACVGALESAVIRKGFADKSLDLSEMHLSYYCFPGEYGIADPLGNISNDYATVSRTGGATSIAAANGVGGHVDETARLFMNWMGPAAESKYTYFDNWGTLGVTYPPESAFDSLYHVQGVYETTWGPDYEEEVKQMILDYGGVATGVRINNGYRQCINGTNTLCSTKADSNHTVVLVGWDDNYPKENFLNSPATDGAWLAKNSYGYVKSEDVIDQSCVEDGYIWVSYCDLAYTSHGEAAIAYEVESKDNYDNNYQYDGIIERSGVNGSMAFSEGFGGTCKPETTFMNVYTAKSGASVEKIEAVSVGTDDNSVYRIKIYTNPVIKNRKMVSYDRVSEETSFIAKSDGLETVKLDEPVYVKQGTDFAVCVITDKDTIMETAYSVELENPLTTGYVYTRKFVDGMEAGQIYIGNGTDMTQLYDISWDLKGEYTCINKETPRIKAYTQNEDIEPATEVYMSQTQMTLEKGQRSVLKASSNSSALPAVYFHSSNPAVATVDSEGNVQAVGYGSCEIVAASEDSGAKAVCTVKVPQPETKQPPQSSNTEEKGAKIGSTAKVKGITYKVKSKTEVICQKAKEDAKTVTIPATVNINKKTYKVTEIAKNAFKGNKRLTKATIGKNIKSIGASAFYGCKNLKNVTIQSKVLKKVGAKAFKGSKKKITFKVPKAKLKSYNKLLKKKSGAYTIKKG